MTTQDHAAVFARVMGPDRRQHFVYRAFDADDALLYVGCTMRPEKRLEEHKYNSRWGRLATRVHFTGPFTYKKARHLEKVAINTENPRFNGHSPENLAARRWENDFIEEHIQVALKHGETFNDACRLALLALDSMTPEDAA